MNEPASKKIVIVDDDIHIVNLLTYALNAKGFQVLSFEKGKEALDFLLDDTNMKNTALLILDRVLPDMDGIEILRAWKNKYAVHPPVFILSLLASEKDVLAGVKLGAIDYITKPFNLQVMVEKLILLLGRYADKQ